MVDMDLEEEVEVPVAEEAVEITEAAVKRQRQLPLLLLLKPEVVEKEDSKYNSYILKKCV